MTVWIVDDHAASARAVAEVVRALGYEVRTFGTAEAALEAAGDQPPCTALITDLRLPGTDGLALFERFHARWPEVGVVVMTAYGTIDEAVRAVKAGAVDFLAKPLVLERVETAVLNAVARSRTETELRRLRAENEALRPNLVHRSAAMRAAVEAAVAAADSDATVLVLGESGTGKEKIARLLHERSPRAAGPFVATHLAALAEGVLESELFGHERGAFTGAAARHLGRFEQAQGGTLFLDEIGEIDARTQVKLLRVLQERAVVRVGGTQDVKVDVRLVAATNRDLEAEVAAGRFRADLYYRLNVVRIRLPPLRERRDDIVPLLAHFLAQFAARYRRPAVELPPDLLQALAGYAWPGNVRELENVAERLVVVGPDRVRADEFRAANTELPEGDVDLVAWLERHEEALLRRALGRAAGNKASAARSLGISREALRYKLAKYGLE